MVMQNRALVCALYILINSQYSSNMHINKQLELFPKLNYYLLYMRGSSF